MGERHSWAVGDSANRLVDTEEARLATTALWPYGSNNIDALEGIRVGPGDPGRVKQTGTPGPNVTVNAFQSEINSSRAVGAYTATLDSTKTVPILDVPADPSNQRNDLVIAQQNDAAYGDADRLFTVKRVLGTPGAGDPNITGSPDWIRLARVRVTAGATSITDAMIDDLRPPFLVALGGQMPIRSLTERDSLPTPFDGQRIYRLDKGFEETHAVGAWRLLGLQFVGALADVTHPYTGQLVLLASDNMVYRWTGSAWVGAFSVGGTAVGTRHRAKYTQTAPMQSIGNATQQRLLFNNIVYSTTDWVTSTVGGGTVFTCAREGSYLVICNVRLGGAGAGERALTLALDGDPNTIYAISNGGTQGIFPWSASVSFDRDFSVGAGNSFAAYLYQSSGGAVPMVYADITIRYLGPKAT